MDVKYSTDTKVKNCYNYILDYSNFLTFYHHLWPLKVEDCLRMFKLQQAAFDKEINTAKAEAALAYELSAAKVSQKLKGEEKMCDVIERKKLVEV